MKKVSAILILGILLMVGVTISLKKPNEKHSVKTTHITKQTLPPRIINIGFFPNITHAHALIAQNFQRDGIDWFKPYLPEKTHIVWQRFNAGPSAMESLLTQSLDVTYVGPSPALNLYFRSKGEEVRLLSGAVKGGSGLVVQPDLQISKPQDWLGKRIASPQYANTQDIDCKAWFLKQNLPIGFGQNQVIISPTSNPDQLLLFKKKAIVGAWTIEPWLTRLVQEAQGVLYYENPDNWTTILVASQVFCETRLAEAKQLIQAHQKLGEWILEHPQEACQRLKNELKIQTNLEFPIELIEQSLSRMKIQTDISQQEFETWVQAAQMAGFFKNLSQLPTLERFFQFANYQQ